MWMQSNEIAIVVKKCDISSLAPQLPHRGKTLKDLFQQAGTDKFEPHRYYRNYDRTFSAFRDVNDLRLLEIGAQYGNSLNAWDGYFSNARHIVGLAYGSRVSSEFVDGKFQRGRVSVVWGNQSNKTLLRQICETYGPFHIVVDDGSHVPSHVLASFEELGGCMQRDALYTIEDIGLKKKSLFWFVCLVECVYLFWFVCFGLFALCLFVFVCLFLCLFVDSFLHTETSYWDKKDATIYGMTLGKVGLRKEDNVVEKFKNVADVINRQTFLNPEYSVIRNDHNIASITFERNLIVMRFLGLEDRNEPYRYPEFVNKQP